MKINPKTIRALDRAARIQGDDPFFAVRHDHRWFISNWVFCVDCDEADIVNCDEFLDLRDRADDMAENDPKYQDILYHLTRRPWTDLLLGQGIYQEADLARMCADEMAAMEEKNTRMIAVSTDSGVRYYVREIYLDLAEVVVDMNRITVFKPMSNCGHPAGYHPLIVFDSKGEARGLCNTISETSLMERTKDSQFYQKYLDRNRVLETPPVSIARAVARI